MPEVIIALVICFPIIFAMKNVYSAPIIGFPVESKAPTGIFRKPVNKRSNKIPNRSAGAYKTMIFGRWC